MRIIDEIMPKIKAEARLDKDNQTLWIKADTLDGYDRIIIEDGSNWCRIFYEDCGECAHNKAEQDEPTISKMEQVDKDINVRSKDEPQIFTWGKEVHEFCKMKCNKSKARSFDGDRFIVCGQSNDAICINLPACPLGKWITGKGYHILPMDESQTERSE